MKKISNSKRYPTFARAGLAIVIGVWLFACSSASSIANTSASENPNQFMADGVLISRENPSIAIDVADEFEFVGRHSFTIREVAAGERFVFAQANGSTITKLLIVQFEGFLPGIDDLYRYDLTRSPVVAGYPFRSNGYAFNIVQAIAANPKSESAATHPFLESKGFSVPDELLMWRSLTVADEVRRKEMIIFYHESVKSTGLTLRDLYVDDRATDAWIEIQKDLEVRANNSFRLKELDDADNPNASEWSSIPNQFMK